MCVCELPEVETIVTRLFFEVSGCDSNAALDKWQAERDGKSEVLSILDSDIVILVSCSGSY